MMDMPNFLQEMFRGSTGGLISIFQLPEARTRFFSLDDIGQAVTYVQGLQGSRDVYVGRSMLQEEPLGGRGKEEDVGCVPGLFVDIDIAGPGHAASNLPLTAEEALATIGQAGLPEPTLVIHTGGGLHLHWLFTEPAVTDTVKARAEFKAASVAWGMKLRQEFTRRGWHLDTTFDLARVVRIPGTLNHKVKNNPRPVSLICEGERISLETVQSLVKSELKAARQLTPSNGEGSLLKALAGPEFERTRMIVSGCGWMERLVQGAESGLEITEPNWHALGDVLDGLDRQKGDEGSKAFHLISARDPRYDRNEAEAKLRRSRKVAPRTCAKIESDGCAECRRCPFGANPEINSPIALAYGVPELIPIQREWALDTQSGLYIHLESGETKTDKAFDRFFGHHVATPTRAMVGDKRTLRADRADYLPGSVGLVVEQGRERVLNQWRPGGVAASAEGDASPIVEHLAYLVPDEAERHHLVSFLAHLIQRPAEKIAHAILLQTQQGVGKGALEQLIRRLVGDDNVENVFGGAINDRFAPELANCQVLILDELELEDRGGSYNRLKMWITSEFQRVERKGVDKFEARTARGTFIFTNGDRPLKIDQSDRRLFVVRNEVPPRDSGYYRTLFSALEDDAVVGAFKAMLLAHDLKDWSAAAPPPDTASKLELIAASASMLEQELIAAREDGIGPFVRNVYTVDSVVSFLRERLKGQQIPRQRVEMMLRALGDRPLDPRPTVRGQRVRPWVWRDHDHWVQAGVALLKVELERFGPALELPSDEAALIDMTPYLPSPTAATPALLQ